MERTVYFENTEEPDGPSLKGSFQVNFLNATSAEVKSTVGFLNGNPLGKQNWFQPRPEKSELKPAQLLLMKVYPGVDLLQLDPNDPASVDAMVKTDEVGDTLFTFLWREIGQFQPDETEHVIQALEDAIRDIETVRDGLCRELFPQKVASAR